MAGGEASCSVKVTLAGFDAQGAALRHGVARVDGQVEDQLLHLAGIGPNARRRRRPVHFQLDGFAQDALQQVGHVRHHAVQGQQLWA